MGILVDFVPVRFLCEQDLAHSVSAGNPNQSAMAMKSNELLLWFGSRRMGVPLRG
jgi:hypothetical protein